VLFAGWWVGYGRTAPSYITPGHVLALPEYIADSAAAGLSSLTGLTGGILSSYTWGPTLLALALVGSGVWIHRRKPSLQWLLVVAVAALMFWALTGASFTPGREPVASRYQLVSGTFILLLAAELLRSVTWRAKGLMAVAAAGLLAIGANAVILKTHGYDFLHERAGFVKTDLGALEIMRGQVGRDFRLTPPIAHDPYLSQVTAGAYFREAAAHGTPAASPSEIAVAPIAQRQAADSVLVAGYGIHLELVTPRTPAVTCRTLGRAPPGAPTALQPGTTRIANRGAGAADLTLRRFGPAGAATALGSVPRRAAAAVAIPGDSAKAPWILESNAALVLQACA
jgi:hypothetical protein